MIESTADLSLEQRVGQLFFIGIRGPQLDPDTFELLSSISPGGVCLFARNIRGAVQVRELLDGIRSILPKVPFLSVDQEGGMVDRLRRIITPMPAASRFHDADSAGRFGAIIGETLRILGFNMDFAPVVDVITQARESVSNGLFSRAFGTNAEEAASLAAKFLTELQNGGCVGCLKHFPGLGASAADSHEELPKVLISDDELRSVDLLPYERLLRRNIVHSVMVAHAAYPNSRLQETDAGGKLLPSSLNVRIITDLLRNELQFDGLVITDDLEMGAIIKNYGIGEACKMAISAGADMLAICADTERIREGHDAVLSAVRSGEISEERIEVSLSRIGRAKTVLIEPLPFSESRLGELSDSIARLNLELEQ